MPVVRRNSQRLMPYPRQMAAPMVFISHDEAPMSVPERAQAKRKGRRGSQHVPRPANAFILFRQDYCARMEKEGKPAQVGGKHASSVIGQLWKSLSPEEQAEWKAKAEDVKQAHRVRHPDYKYCPVHKKNGPEHKKGPPTKAALAAAERRARERAEKARAQDEVEVFEFDSGSVQFNPEFSFGQRETSDSPSDYSFASEPTPVSYDSPLAPIAPYANVVHSPLPHALTPTHRYVPPIMTTLPFEPSFPQQPFAYSAHSAHPFSAPDNSLGFFPSPPVQVRMHRRSSSVPLPSGPISIPRAPALRDDSASPAMVPRIARGVQDAYVDTQFRFPTASQYPVSLPPSPAAHFAQDWTFDAQALAPPMQHHFDGHMSPATTEASFVSHPEGSFVTQEFHADFSQQQGVFVPQDAEFHMSPTQMHAPQPMKLPTLDFAYETLSFDALNATIPH